MIHGKARNVIITGTGHAVPTRVLSNFDLEKMVDTSDEWIRTRTGILRRRVADEHTATSDLAAEAGRLALKDAGVSPEELDLIIVATITPDMLFPSTSCLVQKNLEAWGAACYDLSAGCSGLIYGLDMAVHSIASGAYQRALVIGADCISKVLNFQDRSTCVLFGDGAGACLLEAADQAGVLASRLGADGRGWDKLLLRGGGSRHPASPATLAAGWHYIEMCGNDVFKFAVRIMVEASLQVLADAGLQPEDIDLFIPHQANIRIIESAAQRLNLTEDQVYVNLDEYGNTSAASIGIALDEAVRSGRIKGGDRVLLVGFGAGLTWGAMIIEWVEKA
ncbi:MAG: ketoacyl-ACP synthase III [Firmicutes bacterium]|jgi:3-oxoacyl-[acyl-carrier-protein] synthase-3|nr:ketoacyl-ACP synthase III [Bacillota bacterium]